MWTEKQYVALPADEDDEVDGSSGTGTGTGSGSGPSALCATLLHQTAVYTFREVVLDALPVPVSGGGAGTGVGAGGSASTSTGASAAASSLSNSLLPDAAHCDVCTGRAASTGPVLAYRTCASCLQRSGLHPRLCTWLYDDSRDISILIAGGKAYLSAGAGPLVGEYGYFAQGRWAVQGGGGCT